MTWLDKTLSAVGLQRKPAAKPMPAPIELHKRPRDYFEYFVEEQVDGHHWLTRAYIHDTEPDIVRGHERYAATVVEQRGAASTHEAARREASAWGRKQTGAA